MPEATATDLFEANRSHLVAVAYRMLGSRADAEDAVQEAWLRWNDTDRDAVRDPTGWLTTVTARICLDQLRSARVRREAYVGQWLPEPLVERLPAGDPDPADQVADADRVSYALMVVLERLTAEQRVAFVLHDVFAVPFDEIATVLATSPGAARQLASRARRAVSEQHPPPVTALAEQRRLLSAFLDAAQSGDIDALLRVLAPEAVAAGDGGGVAPASPRPIVGALAVARFVAGLFRRFRRGDTAVRVEPVLINGDLGLLGEVEMPDGSRLLGTMSFGYSQSRVWGVFSQLNPTKIGDVPPPDPARAPFPLVFPPT